MCAVGVLFAHTVDCQEIKFPASEMTSLEQLKKKKFTVQSRMKISTVYTMVIRGFTVKPTAMYVDECLDIVQMQNAKAVMTPLTEQKSLNLHDETTVCGQVQHSLFRAVVGKLQHITAVRPDLMFATKC